MYKYKDLPEIIADMLIKQDQTIEAIYHIGKKTDRTNEILEEFMAVSVKQWEQQTKFIVRFYEKLEKFEKVLEKLSVLEDRVKHLENLEARVAKIERLLNTWSTHSKPSPILLAELR